MFKSYFEFSKKELNGILVLCVIIFLIFISPYVIRFFKTDEVYQFTNFDREVTEFLATAKKNDAGNYYSVKDEIEDASVKPTYFFFDPNGLPANSWRKLGLSAKQIKGIKNYEAKGGKFYRNSDLQKMYTISAAQFALLEPYIRIRDSKKKFTSFKYDVKSYPKYEAKPRTVISVDINLADSAELETLRGIGPAFASRIIKFRNRLGGFHSKEQLMDVYGLDSLKYEMFKDQVRIDQISIKRIDVNSASFDELKNNPYLSYKQINAIIQYRKQHGNYKSISDLEKIAILNARILRKIEPYLAFQ